MPMYDYKCKECGHKFEELVFSSAPDDSIICPECKQENAERLLCAPMVMTGGSSSSGSFNSACGSDSGFS